MTQRHAVPHPSSSSQPLRPSHVDAGMRTDFAAREFGFNLAIGPAVMGAILNHNLDVDRFATDLGMTKRQFTRFVSGTDTQQKPVNPVRIIEAFRKQGALFYATRLASSFFKNAGNPRDLPWWKEATALQSRISTEYFPELSGPSPRHHLVPRNELSIAFEIPHTALAAK